MSLPYDLFEIKRWLVEAGTIALRYYQTQLTLKQKDDYSPVTEADEMVENFLIDKIRQTYNRSDYGIIAEESGGSWQGKEFTWAIDPIDGTRVFINGIPLWCISIGLLQNGEAVRGAVYLPVTNDMYYTDNQGIAFWNNRPLQGMLQTSWDRDTFIGISSGAHRHFIIDFQRLRALGSVATHHVYVASGSAVAALHHKVSLWDIAGAHAILTAVGGRAVYLDGTPVKLAEVLTQEKKVCQGPILAGHPIVLEKLLPKIKTRQGNAKE